MMPKKMIGRNLPAAYQQKPYSIINCLNKSLDNLNYTVYLLNWTL